jgi:hypothetical protein
MLRTTCRALKHVNVCFYFVCLSMKETYPAISQRLKVNILCFSTVKIIRYHGTILTKDGFIIENQYSFVTFIGIAEIFLHTHRLLNET